MAAKKPETKENYDSMTTAVVKKAPVYNGPYVDVYLPKLEESGDMAVDQYEHVTIANEEKETCFKVLRGKRVAVPVPVFMVLKEKYPEI